MIRVPISQQPLHLSILGSFFGFLSAPVGLLQTVFLSLSAGSTDDSFEVWPNFPDTRSDDTSTTVSSEHFRTNAEPRYPQRDRHPPVRYDPSGL